MEILKVYCWHCWTYQIWVTLKKFNYSSTRGPFSDTQLWRTVHDLENIEMKNDWVTDLTLFIRLQFSLRLDCSETLWFYTGKADYKAFHRALTVIYPKNY